MGNFFKDLEDKAKAVTGELWEDYRELWRGGFKVLQDLGGYTASKQQKEAIEQQKQATDAALASSLGQERRSQEAIARANRKAPSIGAMLVGAMEIARAGGNGATMLRGTSPSGSPLGSIGLGLPGQSRQAASNPLVDPVTMQPRDGALLGQ